MEGGVTFGDLPDWVTSSFRKGHSGEDIAVETVNRYLDVGHRFIYLLAPIHRGGRRDYAACQRVIERVREAVGPPSDSASRVV